MALTSIDRRRRHSRGLDDGKVFWRTIHQPFKLPPVRALKSPLF